MLAVPARNLGALQQICREESVELAALGTFGPPTGSSPGDPALSLLFHGKEVGRLSMHFLHEGIPTPHREATWTPSPPSLRHSVAPSLPPSPPSLRHSVAPSLLTLLSHPNIASKHWIIRQYDHEVRGSTLIKPLVGPLAAGPSDAAVISPVPGSRRALAISQGLQTGIGDPNPETGVGGDPYLMALAAIDECVRNLVCVGADPSRIAILDNFCWPSCTRPENLGSLVRAAEGCYDAAKAYGTPFVSGKDSLNNQFTTDDGRTIEVPPTLLITGIGIVPDVARCTTMDAKAPGNLLVLVGNTTSAMGGSHFQQTIGGPPGMAAIDLDAVLAVPRTDLVAAPRTARAVASLISRGLVQSAHDCSDGGLLCAVSEMLIAGSTDEAAIGAAIDLAPVHEDPHIAAFAETPGRYVLEVRPADLPTIRAAIGSTPLTLLGKLDTSGQLSLTSEPEPTPVSALTKVWTSPLDW